MKFEDGERRERNEKWMKDKCEIVRGRAAEKVREVVDRVKSKGDIVRDREKEDVEKERKKTEVGTEEIDGNEEKVMEVEKTNSKEEETGELKK